MNKSTLKYIKTYRLNYLNTSFTMADPLRGGTHFRWLTSKAVTVAFTMAEILLSLTIIGVVAAITLPTLTGNINERTWNAQRKALYARMSQAIGLMPNLNGYGIGATNDETVSKAAETFITEGLAKVLKINNICDNNHFADCGLPDKFTVMRDSETKVITANIKRIRNDYYFYGGYNMNTDFILGGITHDVGYSLANTYTAAFETQNGESILTFYQPYCRQGNLEKKAFYSAPLVCANFIYDLNGKKGPNRIGKDMGFITVIYPTDSIVIAPMPLAVNAKNPEDGSDVIPYNKQYLAYAACRKLDDGARLPTIEEAIALQYNTTAAIENASSYYYTGKMNYNYQPGGGLISSYSHSDRYRVRCVKR